MATTPWYTTRERVRAVMGAGRRLDARIDEAIGAASRIIEGDTHRIFYPTTETRYYDWPSAITSRSWRLWFDEDATPITISSLTVDNGDTTETVANFNLEPVNLGPPYTHLEADLSTTSAFGASDTHQQAIAITGVFGYDNVTKSAGAIAEDLTSSETDVTVNDGGLVGVGDLITINSELMMVTDVTLADSSVDTNGTVNQATNDATIPVDGAGLAVGETIRIDDEEMLVRTTGSSSLTVDRAVNGTTLASHSSGTSIFADIVLTVERGAQGSTAATHSSSDSISKQVYPELISQWCVAEAVVILHQQGAGFARTAGTGENQAEAIGRGLKDIRERALARYGRRHRIAAI